MERGDGITPPEFDNAEGNAVWNKQSDQEAAIRKGRKEAVKERLLAEVPESSEGNLDDLMAQVAKSRETSAANVAELFGIVRKENGKYNFRIPGRGDLPGARDNENVMKAILAKVLRANTTEERWAVALDVFDYFGVEVPDDIDIRTYEEDSKFRRDPVPSFLEKLRKSIPNPAIWAGVIGLLFANAHFSEAGSSDNGELVGFEISGSESPNKNPDLEISLPAVYKLKKGETLKDVAKMILTKAGAKLSFANVFTIATVLAQDSGVGFYNELSGASVAGERNDTQLPVGTPVVMDGAIDVAGKM